MASADKKLSRYLTSYRFGVVTLILVYFMVATFVTAQFEIVKPDNIEAIDCRKYQARGVKLILKNFNKCSRELKANSTKDGNFDEKEYENNIGCAMKCTMRALNFSSDDIVTLDTIKGVLVKLVPDILFEPAFKFLVSRCHEKYESMLDPQDPQCKAYSEYAFCLQNAVADMVASDYCLKFDKNGKPISKESK